MGVRKFLKDLVEGDESPEDAAGRAQLERSARGSGSSGSQQRGVTRPDSDRSGRQVGTMGGADRGRSDGQPWDGGGLGLGYTSEPDLPLHPHAFQPRLQLLKMPPSPRVMISSEAYKRICLIIELSPKEVGWVGTVDRLDNGDFYIDEVFIPEQEVTATHTDPSEEGLFNVMNDLVEQGEEGMEKIGRLRFWGHSHVHMGTSPSGQDEQTPLKFQEQGLPWFIRAIFNKHGRAEFTVYLFEEERRFVDAPWAVVNIDSGNVIPLQKSFDRDQRDRDFDCDRDRDRADRGPSGQLGSGLAGGRVESERRGGFGGLLSRAGKARVELPESLTPTDAERKAVKAELSAKVKELRFFGWRDRDGSDSRDGRDRGFGPGSGDSGDGRIDYGAQRRQAASDGQPSDLSGRPKRKGR